jgi:prepilin-type N-terminal cleavage/methylation domain-containing protein
MSSRLRSDDGFTVTELLVAMVIGSVVLTALMGLFVTGMNSSAKVNDRVAAAQGARSAMDEITTLLDAQTCQAGAPPVVDGQGNSITFYANRGAVDTDPTQYRLRYDAASRRVFQDTYTPTQNAAGDPVYPASPTAVRMVGESIVPIGAATSIFSYYGFPAAGSATPTLLTAPLSSSDRTKVVRISVAFTVVPLRTGVDDARSTDIQGQSIANGADPNNAGNGPNC